MAALRNLFRRGTIARRTLSLGLAGLYGHFFWAYCYEICFPWGPSMLPTIGIAQESLIISKFHRYGKNVGIGDIVSYKRPDKQHYGLKRVAGMPGDFVLLNAPDAKSEEMMQIPQGHCFLVGDNQKYSIDSRLFGPVPLALITGKVVYRVWPFSRAGPIESNMQELAPGDPA